MTAKTMLKKSEGGNTIPYCDDKLSEECRLGEKGKNPANMITA